MPISAEEATKAAVAAVQSNMRRRVPKLPAMLQKVSEDTKVWLYNVGPWTLTRELGSIGTFRIPGCPEGKEYAAADPIPGVFTEPIQGQDQNTMELRTEEGGGRYIAEQVLGVGPFIHPRDSFVPMGVFIGSQVGPDAKPTKQELAEAKQKLFVYLEGLVNEARKAYESGNIKEIVDRHRTAARMLKLENEQWYSTRSAKARQDCPMCGTIVNEGVVLCPNCKFILDEAKYEKMKARLAK